MKLMPLNFFFTTLYEDLPLEEIVDEVKDFDDRFRIILRKHLAVLGWWCFICFGTGVIGLIRFDGQWFYFFLMNISWALINFAIVTAIFNHVFYQRFLKGNVFQRFEVQRHVEKMLWLNIGLDVAYIFAGLYLHALGAYPETAHAALWTGFGWSVMVQGIYLFVQDNAFHYLHYLNFRKAEPFLEDVIESQLAWREQTGRQKNQHTITPK